LPDRFSTVARREKLPAIDNKACYTMSHDQITALGLVRSRIRTRVCSGRDAIFTTI
jgi:hypothetical protein